jgi:hypothetical protein
MEHRHILYHPCDQTGHGTRPPELTLTPEIKSVTIESMNTDWSSALAGRARLHAALGEPARLAIVDLLTLGDAAPSELGKALGLPSNLLATT